MEETNFVPYGGSSSDVILPDSNDLLAEENEKKGSFTRRPTHWDDISESQEISCSDTSTHTNATDLRTKASGDMLLDEGTIKTLQRLSENNEMIVKREPWDKPNHENSSQDVMDINQISQESDAEQDLLIRREPLEVVEIADVKGEEADISALGDINSKTPKLTLKKRGRKKKPPGSGYTPTINCKLCEIQFRDEYGLKIHMRVHTGEKPFPCGICGKSFRRISAMKQHELIHTGAKPYPCSFCGKSFTQSSNQRKHERLHQGIKPFLCSQCGKAFIDRHGLQDHFRVHTGEKPFSCSRCDKKFAHASDVKVHMRVHTGERPYPCALCDMRFTQSGALKVHIRTHTKDKPLHCPLCDKSFADPSTLERHIISHNNPKGLSDRKPVRLQVLPIKQELET